MGWGYPSIPWFSAGREQVVYRVLPTQESLPDNVLYSSGTLSPVLRPSTPSSGASVCPSRAETSDDELESESTTHHHTSISIFPQGSRLSVNVSPHKKSTSGPPILHVGDTSFELPDRDEDYEDVPYEHGAGAWPDTVPEPEIPSAKRSCTRASDKASAVSTHFYWSCPFADNILSKETPSKILFTFVTSYS